MIDGAEAFGGGYYIVVVRRMAVKVDYYMRRAVRGGVDGFVSDAACGRGGAMEREPIRDGAVMR